MLTYTIICNKPAWIMNVLCECVSLRALSAETSSAVLRPDTCGLRRVAGWPAGRAAPCWSTITIPTTSKVHCCTADPALTCRGSCFTRTVHVYSQSVHTLRDCRRCRWLMYSPKSSASCRSRASAPNTDRGTGQGSSLVSWSYPCSPPPRWNPEGSSPWCHPGPPGMWEEVVSVVVVGCGHPGTSVRKALRTASAPAPALMKPFWSLSSYPRFRCPSSKRNVSWGKRKFYRWSWERNARFKRRRNTCHPLPKTHKWDMN